MSDNTNNWVNTLFQFAKAIHTDNSLPKNVASTTHYSLARGIAVYRNNYRGNLHDALACVYPVIQQLVGEDFFRLLAKHYIDQYPSNSGNLHYYGKEMGAFLTQFESVQHLPYLPDMAQLEWAYHCAYIASNMAMFDLQRLTTIPPEDYATLNWQLHPSCTLLTTLHPVATVWEMHQEYADTDFQVDLNSGGDSLLIFRQALKVSIIRVDPSHLHWLVQLQQGATMGTATEQTLSVHANFDLLTTLQHWLAQGVLIDFYSTA